MRLLEELCGGNAVWENIFLIITRRDYNSMLEEEEDWIESLKAIEKEALRIVNQTFKSAPTGCIALSMMYPKDKKRKMDPVIKKVMHEKFKTLKETIKNCKGFETQ